ncbi:MAG TPA: DUF664 domain-containing protein [Microbacteriaceae bacterium]
MGPSQVLIDAFDRIQKIVHAAIRDASAETLAYRPDAEANSVAWLVWHLTRVQDDHLADAFGTRQVWTDDDWAVRFGLPFADSATGYGHSRDEVASVRVSAELLRGYHDNVHDRTIELLKDMTAQDVERIVDTAWDPPVTLAVRLISVISDDLQHAGQASYVRGLAKRAGV